MQPKSGKAKDVVKKQAKKFTYRLSDPYVPLEGREQDRHFPALEKLDYYTKLVAVNETAVYQY